MGDKAIDGSDNRAPEPMARWVGIVLGAGGVIFFILSAHMATEFSIEFGEMLGWLGIGGQPALSGTWLYPTAMTLILLAARVPDITVAAARFVAVGILSSLVLFLLDPAFRIIVHIVSPDFFESEWAARISRIMQLAAFLAWGFFVLLRELRRLGMESSGNWVGESGDSSSSHAGDNRA